MIGTIALAGGVALIIAGVALFVVERAKPGVMAAWLRSKFGKPPT